MEKLTREPIRFLTFHLTYLTEQNLIWESNSTINIPFKVCLEITNGFDFDPDSSKFNYKSSYLVFIGNSYFAGVVGHVHARDLDVVVANAGYDLNSLEVVCEDDNVAPCCVSCKTNACNILLFVQ